MNLPNKISPITILFLILLLINLLSSVLLGKISIEHKTSLQVFNELNYMNSGNDSWGPMILALEEFDLIKDSSPIYSNVFFDKQIKFQYPPSSLLIYVIPSKIFNLPYSHITAYYMMLSFVSIFLIGLLCIKIYSLVLKNLDITFPNKIELYFNYLLIFLLCYLFYPLTKSFTLGQIQTLLTFSITLSMLFYLQNKYTFAGIFFGLVCLVKPHFIIVLVWSVLRKKWRFFNSSSITILIFGLISLYYFGLRNHLDYLNTLSFLSKHGESFYANQSINGLFNRLFFNGSNLKWNDPAFPPFLVYVYIPTLISSLVFISFALYNKHKDPILEIIGFSIIILSVTISSPITWEHHYSVLFPIFVSILVPYCNKVYKEKFKFNNLFFLFLIIVYSFASQNVSVLNYFAESKLNILQSYLFFSALFILILLYKILYKVKNNPLTKTEL